MFEPLLVAGVAATVAAVTLVVLRWTTRPRVAAYPLYGGVGLALLAVSELLLFRGMEPVATYFTPLAWTCYLLAVDAAVFALRGQSRLGSTPRQFAALAFWSVPLWLVFEAYNLHLRNWTYVGMPEALWEQMFGSAWAFATILPALFETADLLAALGFFEGASARGWRFWLRLQPAHRAARVGAPRQSSLAGSADESVEGRSPSTAPWRLDCSEQWGAPFLLLAEVGDVSSDS